MRVFVFKAGPDGGIGLGLAAVRRVCLILMFAFTRGHECLGNYGVLMISLNSSFIGPERLHSMHL